MDKMTLRWTLMWRKWSQKRAYTVCPQLWWRLRNSSCRHRAEVLMKSFVPSARDFETKVADIAAPLWTQRDFKHNFRQKKLQEKNLQEWHLTIIHNSNYHALLMLFFVCLFFSKWFNEFSFFSLLFVYDIYLQLFLSPYMVIRTAMTEHVFNHYS